MGDQVNFCVPSGNFGNCLAGWFAKNMGLPVNKFIAASNKNNILTDFFTTGKYDMFIKLYARNNHHLLSIIHDKLQPLGLARTETLISFHEAIKRQMPIMVEVDED